LHTLHSTLHLSKLAHPAQHASPIKTCTPCTARFTYQNLHTLNSTLHLSTLSTQPCRSPQRPLRLGELHKLYTPPLMLYALLHRAAIPLAARANLLHEAQMQLERPGLRDCLQRDVTE